MTMTRGFYLLLILLIFLPFESGAESQIPELPVKIVLFPVKKAVISSKVNSFVKKYNFKEGEEFKEGDIIAELDNRFYTQNYLKTKSAVAESRANLEFAKNTYKRNKELFSKNALGAQDLELSKLEMETSLSKLHASEANMKIAQINVEDCTIKAPFSGRLVKKIIHDHEFVNAGQPIMEIIKDHELLATMYLPSIEMKNIKIGDKMTIKIDETGSKHKAVVYEISGKIDPGSRTFELKALVDNKNQKLSAGMSGMLLKKGADE